jgi:hypothetical protein
VETIIAPSTAVPSECGLSELAPLAKTSGNRPALKAIDVMRIGRSRVWAAAINDLRGRYTFRAFLDRNSTIKTAFLAAGPVSIT